MRRAGWYWVALAIVTAWACVDDVRLPAAQVRYCSALCARLVECSPAYSRSLCLSTCNTGSPGPPISEQIYALQIECIREASCEALLSAEGTECFDQAIEALVPTDTCIDHCLEDATASYECGAGYSVEECINGGVCAWHDDVLADALECNASTEDCDARVECLDRVFGGPE